MKAWCWFLLLMTGSVSAAEKPDELGKWQASAPPTETEPVTWLDSSHAYATNQAQALTEWMDAFFGDPNYNLEQAESQLRLEFVEDWDEELGNKTKVRLRGKVQLPRVSRRLHLVFQGEDSNGGTQAERQDDDEFGLQYELRTGTRSRFDVTASFASGNLRPGVRYRNEGNINDANTYRYIHRLQYQDGKGFFTTPRLDINHHVDNNNIIRWSNRLQWGEYSDGIEWGTQLAWRQRLHADSRRPTALAYFAGVSGVTQPDVLTRNYALGMLWRRQVYRDYLFVELEPVWNYRRLTKEDERAGAWSIVLRLEVALERDLRRVK